jgi:hypothetical protein
MINIFKSNENAILVQKQRNRALRNDADRLLEQVLNADILSVIMNALYESDTSMLVDDHSVDNDLLKTEIETLTQENEMIRQHNDDVQTKLSNEICQLKQRLEWCQAQSIKRELQLQSQNVSKSCQNCNNNEFFKNQCLTYEMEIADLKIENAEWQQNRNDVAYWNRKLESDIQEKITSSLT